METLKVLWLDLNGLSETQYSQFAQQLPADRLARAAHYRHPADRHRSLAAGILLQHAMNLAHIPAQERILSIGSHGKPELSGRTDFQFSLSHSGPIALCAFGSVPLGADVEVPERPALQIVERKCPPGEWAWLQTQPDPQAAFFRLWVLKEAYVKALGTGLTLGLKQYELHFDETVSVWQNQQRQPWYFYETRLGGCPAALCAAAALPCQWVSLSVDELLASGPQT